jgi:hypothetical protein
MCLYVKGCSEPSTHIIFGQCLELNSGPLPCKEGALSLEMHPKPEVIIIEMTDTRVVFIDSSGLQTVKCTK